ncbi:hypothetical protein DH86_00002509 [Scytalidium sp. 3C]|nr:hypothetical protein DH86_00002509 [Scytalidium sp. 3C]
MASYNYNTALPNSVVPSVPSIPSSPPPSFRSSQSVNDDIDLSPGTPRATSQANVQDWNDRAPSALGGATSASDANLQIAALKRRLEQLEECVGKLMLEKERQSSDDSHGKNHQGSNCCVTFADASGDIERDFYRYANGGSNCCVTFGKKDRSHGSAHKKGPIIVGLVLFNITLLVLLIVSISKNKTE